jgi:hypothetical protein
MRGALSLISELDGDTMDENELKLCAAAARGKLPDLIVDAQERERVDKQLAGALALPSGTANIALRRALRSHDAIHRFMLSQAAATNETEILGADRAVGLLGKPLAIGVYFICPKCGHKAVRETLSDETPTCPDHGAVMIRTSG